MLDPNTGEPVVLEPRQLLVMPAKNHAARQILFGDSIERVDNQTNALTMRTRSQNTLTPYDLMVSRLAYRRIIASGVTAANAKNWMFFGDFSMAFQYSENWPITVTQAPSNSEAEFTNDIVVRYKASERGAAAVTEPRAAVKSIQA
jgi:hypothetical protein